MNRKEFLTLALVAAMPGKGQTPVDPWAATELIKPEELARRLTAKDSPPPILFVGFAVLYRGARLPGALLAGPCANPQGIEELKKAAKSLARDQEIVIYCGCCPFVKCPNVRPAYATLRDLGFKRIRVLVLETNLHTDWVAKGYPAEKKT
jgi:thiosulfate/3-mercaptopyruvate sulfurtransferase